MSQSYTPPAGDAIDLTFGQTYTPPIGNELGLQFDLGVPIVQPSSSVHVHLAGYPSVGIPKAAGHISTHATASTSLSLPPQVSLLRNLDAHHEHRANKHFYTFDFTAQQKPSRFVNEGWFLELNPARRGFISHGFDAATYGSASLENVSQGITTEGSIDSVFSISYIGEVRAYYFMDLSRFSPVEYPIQLDLVAKNENELFIHQNVLVHTADQCNIGLQIPLLTHDSAHQVASQLATVTHTSPVAGHAALQAHGADQVTIRHEITLTAINAAQQAQIAQNLDLTHRSPANAASSTHSHTADGLQITHTSPLSAHLTLHEVDDDLSAVVNRSVLVAAGANHDHYSEHFALTHFSPLAISDPWHYHRVQRLSFLPGGWVFRALLDIGEADRVIVMDSDNRTAEIPASKSRELEVPAENRVLDVPPEVRELVLEPQGRVSSIGG